MHSQVVNKLVDDKRGTLRPCCSHYRPGRASRRARDGGWLGHGRVHHGGTARAAPCCMPATSGLDSCSRPPCPHCPAALCLSLTSDAHHAAPPRCLRRLHALRAQVLDHLERAVRRAQIFRRLRRAREDHELLQGRHHAHFYSFFLGVFLRVTPRGPGQNGRKNFIARIDRSRRALSNGTGLANRHT